MTQPPHAQPPHAQRSSVPPSRAPRPRPESDPDAEPIAVLAGRALTKFYDGRKVLDAITLTVAPGERVGVVGENGAGKSTLLRLLAGSEETDSGEVVRPLDVGFLHQEMPYPLETTVAQVVADALAEVRALEEDVRLTGEALGLDPGSTDAQRAYDHALERAEAAEVWDADRRAEMTLAGLGIEHLVGRTVAAISGGERTRLGLAALLVRQPGTLLLDEPTNHLDDEAAQFLAAAIRSMPGAVVLASHDREFLDEACTQIFDLDPSPDGASGTLYRGAYRHYRKEKKVERAEWERRYAEEQAELEALRRSKATTARSVGHAAPMKDRNKMSYDFHGGRVESGVSRRVRNAQQRFDVLERSQVRRPPRRLTFRPDAGGLAVAGAPGPVLVARAVAVPGRLAPVSLELAAGSKLLVTGANGSGKSTLLHVLARDVEPAGGEVTWAPGIGVGLLEQDVYLHQDERSPRQLFELLGAADALVGFGLVEGKDLDRALRELSTGQRRRVVLAMVIAHGPELLLLDEPTNHISLSLADELGEAVGSAPGTIVVASHDRWLRRTWTGDVLALTA